MPLRDKDGHHVKHGLSPEAVWVLPVYIAR